MAPHTRAAGAVVVALALAGCIEPSISLLFSPTAASRAASQPASRPFDGYPNLSQLESRIKDLATLYPGIVRDEAIGKTTAGHSLHALTIAYKGPLSPDRRPALLLVAGLDALHRAGPVAAIDLVERLLTQAAADPRSGAARLMLEHTLYVLPLMNPDRLERLTRPAAEPTGANLRPVDDDRDDRVDEDPPEDLNHDGAITMMRVMGKDPSYIADPDDPRLVRKADPVKGEKPVYELYTEGIDNDDDGQYNEDGQGGVNLATNFPHLYQPNQPGSGPYQLSEPETRGLADFVLAHKNIAAVVVFGLHDNLVKPPPGGKPDPTGRSLRDLHADDVAIHNEIAKSFRDLTGLKGAFASTVEGSFYGWCYNQRGIPAFATSLWWPLDDIPASQPASQPASRPASQPASSRPASERGRRGASNDSAAAPSESRGRVADPPPSDEPSPESRARLMRIMGEQAPGPDQRGAPPGGGRGRGRRFGPGRGPDETPQKPPEPSIDTSDDRKWLQYSDMHGGTGFLNWKPWHHPTLGDVEIGGFVPGFKSNPPADAIPGIADKQLSFLIDLADRLPRLQITGTTVKSPGPGVYEVGFYAVNQGYLPTAMAMTRAARRDRPIVIRPQVAPERILGGPKTARIEWLAGSGAREKVRWLLSGKPGERVAFKVYHEPIGEIEHTIELIPTATQPTVSGPAGDQP